MSPQPLLDSLWPISISARSHASGFEWNSPFRMQAQTVTISTLQYASAITGVTICLALVLWTLGRMPMPSTMKLEDTKITDEVVTEGSFVPPQQGEWISDCASTTDENDGCH